jgi:hypothetical protein
VVEQSAHNPKIASLNPAEKNVKMILEKDGYAFPSIPARMLTKNPVKLFNHCGSIRTLDPRILTTVIAWLLNDTKNGILLVIVRVFISTRNVLLSSNILYYSQLFIFIERNGPIKLQRCLTLS